MISSGNAQKCTNVTSRVKVAPLASNSCSAGGLGDSVARKWLFNKGQKKTLKLLKRIRSPEGLLHRAGLCILLAKLGVQDPEPLLNKLHALSAPDTQSEDLVSETVFLNWIGFEV
jgi:hypothetical protein